MNYSKDNAINIMQYKSSRINAKAEPIHAIHLISDDKLTDNRILSQLTNTIESLVYNSIKFNYHIELSTYITINKRSNYNNINNQIYHVIEQLPLLNIPRKRFYSIESAINFIYTLYCLIYPYNTLNIKTIYNDSSIKYFINKYYHSELEVK